MRQIAVWSKNQNRISFFEGRRKAFRNIIWIRLAKIVPIEEMCDQPIEGLLYDLNRGEETILALAKADNIQWVNNFAATQVIKYLYNRVEELKKE